ncbi:HAD-IA family hydrolase [Acinetobacter sp. 194]|uniref:HAD-IA family hydrolase n=1 Tax=Acinetobacter shaoyimingii TaxID=2715164 RepID=UPI001409A730|nr:HAD-IA family hydrolase [Acinetobacter shaoyimingii]NHB57342.1 HAD-IA family hydrolase [Acinetobacter shaoyimingii]
MQVRFQHSTHCYAVQAILFDLDGTLVESTGSIGQILQNWAEQNALDVSKVIAFSHGKRSIDIVRAFIQASEVDAQYQQLTAQFVQVADQAQAVNGAFDILNVLNSKQIPWALVSSSERILIEARLKASGLPMPNVVVAAEDIQQGKPSPEGYLKAAQQLDIPIEACLVFEDAAAGVEAAFKAGAKCVGVGSAMQACTDVFIENYHQILIEHDS